MLDDQHERNQDRFGDMHMDGKHHPVAAGSGMSFFLKLIAALAVLVILVWLAG